PQLHATDTPLAKSSLVGHSGLSRAARAVLILNKYPNLGWSDGSSMTLYGTDQDKANFVRWLTADKKRFPGLEVSVVNNASRTDIKMCMKELESLDPAVVVIYIQGHGSPGFYITGDGPTSKNEYIGIECSELSKLFSEFDDRSLSIVVTDLCYSGNSFRLRYKLELGKDGEPDKWAETEEWDQTSIQQHPHMIHLAGSTMVEQVYETGRIGGYFTNALTKVGTKTLPQLLASLRAEVNACLVEARRYKDSPIGSDATQTPQ
ncbi:hypothetical protein FRC11_001085, partial [Ceratobasidium sp. 423]